MGGQRNAAAVGADLRAVLRVKGLLGRLKFEGIPKDLQKEVIQELQGSKGLSYVDPTQLSRRVDFLTEDGWYLHGVHEMLASQLASLGFEVQKQKVRTLPLDCKWRVTEPAWHPSQEEGIRLLLKKGRGAVEAPTGIGKTYVIASVVAQMKVPALIVVYGADVVSQMEEAFEQFTNVQIGVVAGKRYQPRNVTVATASKLQVMLRSGHQFWDEGGQASVYQTVLIDEAHHAASDGTMTLLETLHDYGTLRGVMAVSATYGRADDREPLLHAYAGPAWLKVPLDEVVGDRLAFLTVEQVDVPPKDYPEANAYREKKAALEEAKKDGLLTAWSLVNAEKRTMTEGGKVFRQIYNDYVVKGQTGRNKIIALYVERMRKQGKTGAIIVDEIEHASRLMKIIPGLVSMVKTSKGRAVASTSKEIAKLKDMLLHREIDWVVTTVFNEAVNIPSLDCIVLAAGGKSWILSKQRLRNTRVCDQQLRTGWYFKDRGYVLFFRDQAPMLERHSQEARRTLMQYVKSNKGNEMKKWDDWKKVVKS